MNGFGGAGAFSDGKYNITNQFGGTLYEYIGKQEALSLMRYVDQINLDHGGAGTKLYSTANTAIKKNALRTTCIFSTRRFGISVRTRITSSSKISTRL